MPTRVCRFLLFGCALGVLTGAVAVHGGESVERAGLDWWAFQEVKRPEVPGGEGEGSSIDAFVRLKLEFEGFEPAPPADERTLIRRLHFDLTGLPPSFEEIEAFAADRSSTAYRDLVDRLMDSEHFGERWARHWLDVVRFAETNGYERDAVKPNIWKFRDWVIRAFNEDMPYDRFVREQLAGDEIPDRTKESVIATGMLVSGTWNDEPNDPQEYKYERLEDFVDVVSTSFLGLTVKCARCHDHKFDPIPQRDYYRFAAAFWPGAIEPRDRALMGGPTTEELGYEDVFGWTDVRLTVPDLRLLKNGDPHHPAEVVEPGNLALVEVLDVAPVRAPEGARTTHRRLNLARFITDSRNPLTARVMVNRLWQQLIGDGIVRTPNNFGFKAAPPTHPELLDWLAADFMDGGWKVKRMIRQIVFSETYRQSSIHPREIEFSERDAGNHFLWRANRRRLDAESLRDAMLAVSGELDKRRGGPSFYPLMAPEVMEGFSRKANAWTPSPPDERHRRSIYMMTKRHLLLPIMTAFDFPNSEKPCGKRDITTVAPQALAMLNNRFVHERSESLAVLGGSIDRLEERVGFVWRRVLGRDPSESEHRAAVRHYRRQLRYFAERRQSANEAAKVPAPSIPKNGLVLHLKASSGISLDPEGRVETWSDLSGEGRHASQSGAERRPVVVSNAIGTRPAVRFDGSGRFLELAGALLNNQECTVVAVASDAAPHRQHRSILSNWNGSANNSTTSLFLGLTGRGTVRFSDDSSSDSPIPDPSRPFILSATNGSGVSVYQQRNAD